MGKTATGVYLITIRPSTEVGRRFEELLSATEMKSESQLGEYLIVKGMDAFLKDRRLGPYSFPVLPMVGRRSSARKAAGTSGGEQGEQSKGASGKS